MLPFLSPLLFAQTTSPPVISSIAEVPSSTFSVPEIEESLGDRFPRPLRPPLGNSFPANLPATPAITTPTVLSASPTPPLELPLSSPIASPVASPGLLVENPQINAATPSPAPRITPSPIPSPAYTPLPPLIRPRTVTQLHEVRPLPGQLNQIPVLNSNSPEVVMGDGILVSTFPAVGKRSPDAHLNLTLEGRFDVFTHHIARTATQEFARPLYFGVLLYNPNSQVVVVDVMQAVAYFTNPDAPFVELPDYVDNFSGNIFSGPGSRLSGDLLRGIHQPRFPNQILLFPGESRMVLSEPTLIGSAVSSLIRLRTNGPVYAASLSMLAPIIPPPPLPAPPVSVAGIGGNPPKPTPSPPPPPTYRAPLLTEWEDLIRNGNLVSPRDLAPTPPNRRGENVIYGRVAGIAMGSLWQGQVTDNPSRQELSIPNQGEAFSYVINTLNRGTFGTGQDQSAPIVARYPDTAYRANGNYGIQYSLSFPLYNGTGQMQAVSIALQTPLKRDEASQGLQFLEPPENEVFFRGTIQIAYQDDFGLPRTKSIHLVQRRGQQGEPLITLRMPPGNRRLVSIDFIYPPDATPPQVLTIRTTNPATTF